MKLAENGGLSYYHFKGGILDMNCSEDSSQKLRAVIYVLSACVILISIFASACANKNAGTSSPSASSQQSSNSSLQNNPAIGSDVNSSTQAGAASTPAQTTPTVTSPTPPAPIQQSTPPSQPAATPNIPTTAQPSTGDLIKKEASLMALTIDDMGQGWVRISVGPPSILYTNSVCHVDYSQGGSFAPVVQNTVAVFRTIQAASNAYDKEKPAYATVSNPAIGDECFLNDSVLINRYLVFRKGNVVVYFWLQQYKDGDIEHYARVVEQRITP